MSINKTTTDIDIFKINYLTQEMYDAALANNQINENELYIVPTEPEFTVKNSYEEILPLTSITFSQASGDNAYAEMISNNPLDISAYETLLVTFDSIKYICNSIYDSQSNKYSFGAPYDSTNSIYDFSVYPFKIFPVDTGEDGIYTAAAVETSGTHIIKIENLSSSSITTSSDFRAAVNYVIDSYKV